MDWEDTTVRTVELGRLKRAKDKKSYKVTYTSYEVPAAYHRLICQLTAEEAHGRTHNSHESRRRQMYARQVLDGLAKEILKNAAKPPAKQISPASFRSQTLTPLLQCQLRGVHDAYMPSVHAATIRRGEDSLTISRMTEVYLRQDPALAYLAPYYRRHLLYIPEPRWYLGVVVNPDRLKDPDFYNAVREHHEEILIAVREEKGKAPHDDRNTHDPHRMPVLRRAEVRAIVLEGLEQVFEQELLAVVFHPTPPITIPCTDCRPCRAISWMR